MKTNGQKSFHLGSSSTSVKRGIARSQSAMVPSTNNSNNNSFYTPKKNQRNSEMKVYNCNVCMVTSLLTKETQSLVYHLSSQAQMKDDNSILTSPNSISTQNNSIQASIYGDSRVFFIPLIESSTQLKSANASIRVELVQCRREAISVEWKSQLRNVDYTIFLFDLTSKSSFDGLTELFNQYLKYSRKKATDNNILLVGKVFNQKTKKRINVDRITSWCNERSGFAKIVYIEYSIMEALGVREMLSVISDKYQQMYNDYRVINPLPSPELSATSIIPAFNLRAATLDFHDFPMNKNNNNRLEIILNKSANDDLSFEHENDRPKTWVALEQAMQAQLEADRVEEEEKDQLERSLLDENGPMVNNLNNNLYLEVERGGSVHGSGKFHRSQSEHNFPTMSPTPHETLLLNSYDAYDYAHPMNIFNEEINISDILRNDLDDEEEDHEDRLSYDSENYSNKHTKQSNKGSSNKPSNNNNNKRIKKSNSRDQHEELSSNMMEVEETGSSRSNISKPASSRGSSTNSTGRGLRFFDFMICGCGPSR